MTPEGWERTTLGEVAQLSSGSTPSRGRAELFLSPDCGGIPWVKTMDLTDGLITYTEEHITNEALEVARLKINPPGTVLVAMYGGFQQIGRSGILSIPATTNQAICSLQLVPSRANPSFCNHWLVGMRGRWRALAASSRKDPNVTKEDVRNFELLLPPLREQRKIAAILSSVNDAIEATQAVIDQLQVVKKAMMAELLTRGLPGRHTRFKQTEIGEVPEGWAVATINSLVERCDYGLSKALNSDDSGVAVLRMGNLKGGYIVLEDLKFVASDEVENNLLLAPGDVLFNRTNSATLVGKVGVFRGAKNPVSFASYLLRLRTNPGRADGFWLSATMNTEANQQQIRSLATPGVSQVNVNRAKMLALRVPVPPLDEQQEIVAALSTVDMRLEEEMHWLSGVKMLKSGLMSALLTGEVRVTPGEAAP